MSLQIFFLEKRRRKRKGKDKTEGITMSELNNCILEAKIEI